MEQNTKSGIKLIAEKAGVSIGTVDRVLHNRPGVNKETRDRVLRIIKELNYQPNILARRLVSKKKFRFAAIIPSQNSNNFWSAHKSGIERANAEISQYGVSIDTLTFNQDDPDTFSECIQKTFDETYDGVLMVPFFTKQSESFVKACERLQTPCVFIDTNLSVEESSSLAFIGQNASKSGYFASRFFSYLVKPEDEVLMVSINATKIADNHVNYMLREEGFRKFVSESNAFSIREFTFNDPDLSKLEDALLDVLKKSDSIKGIFVTNSRSYKVADILEEHNLKGKFRVLGYDLSERNIDHLNKGTIDFLISQDPTQQGYLGIQALYRKLILNEEIFSEFNMPIELISRDNLEFYGRNN